jgi:hypothetical protein
MYLVHGGGEIHWCMVVPCESLAAVYQLFGVYFETKLFAAASREEDLLPWIRDCEN